MRRIGIIARDLNKQSGGTKTYMEGLLGGLNRIVSEGRVRVHVIHNSRKHLSKYKNLTTHYIDEKNIFLFEYIKAPRCAGKLGLDIVVSTKFAYPFRVPARKVCLVYDLAYYLPSLNAYSKVDCFYTKATLSLFKWGKAKFLAISQSTKCDIVRFLRVEGSEVGVVYGAVEEGFAADISSAVLEKVREEYNLPEKFFLYVGNISPRKNLARVLNVFRRVVKKKTDWYLVIVGQGGWDSPEEYRLIRETPNVYRVGFVKPEILPALYHLARVFIYPSLYEGFGLPILEAQAVGCPVLTSNVSSCPEVGGEAVYKVDPYSEQELEDGLVRLMEDEELRRNLSLAGFENVKRFGWEKSARAFVDFLLNL